MKQWERLRESRRKERVCPYPRDRINAVPSQRKVGWRFHRFHLRQLSRTIAHLLTGISGLPLPCSHPVLGIAISHALSHLGKIWVVVFRCRLSSEIRFLSKRNPAKREDLRRVVCSMQKGGETSQKSQFGSNSSLIALQRYELKMNRQNPGQNRPL